MGEALILGLASLAILLILVLFAIWKRVPVSALVRAGKNELSVHFGRDQDAAPKAKPGVKDEQT